MASSGLVVLRVRVKVREAMVRNTVYSQYKTWDTVEDVENVHPTVAAWREKIQGPPVREGAILIDIRSRIEIRHYTE